ncbi:hypothetical protein ATER59S_01276 [Aquamicrobium terrae]
MEAVSCARNRPIRALKREQMAGALDALQCGVVLTDRDGAILHPNRAAEAVLDRGNALQDAGGYLRVRNPTASRELRAAIRLAAQDETALGTAGLAVRLDPSGTKPLFAHVLPLAGGQRRDGMQAEASAAVFISTQHDERFVATAKGARRFPRPRSKPRHADAYAVPTLSAAIAPVVLFQMRATPVADQRRGRKVSYVLLKHIVEDQGLRRLS